MFEVLTEAEATELQTELHNAWLDSNQISYELRGWAAAATDPAMQFSYRKDLQAQRAIRSELSELLTEANRQVHGSGR